LEQTLQTQPKEYLLSVGTLQYFNEEGTHPFADTTPASTEPHPFAENSPGGNVFEQHATQPNPLRQEAAPVETLQSPQGDQGQPLQEEPPTVTELDFGGRKVQMTDPVIGDLHKDYTHLNKTYQQTNQELVQARQMVQQYENLMNQQQQLQPQAQQQEESNAISPERRLEMNETYMEMQYEDKFAADEWWASQPEIQAMNNERLQSEVQNRLNEYIQPIEQERELQQQVAQLQEQYPDLMDHQEAMQQIIDANPHYAELPNAIEAVYLQAKGQAALAQPTREQLLNDPAFLQEIYANENIRNQVMQNYSQQKLQTNKSLPNMMGTNPGSQTPISAGERKPQTLQEATAAARRYRGQQQ
jgi:hypothetical protein